MQIVWYYIIMIEVPIRDLFGKCDAGKYVIAFIDIRTDTYFHFYREQFAAPPLK